MISFSPTDCTDYHRLIFHAGHSCNATDVGSPTSWLDLHRFYDKFVSTQIGHTLLYCHFYECLYIELSILFVLSPWQNISKLYSSPPPPPPPGAEQLPLLLKKEYRRDKRVFLVLSFLVPHRSIALRLPPLEWESFHAQGLTLNILIVLLNSET